MGSQDAHAGQSPSATIQRKVDLLISDIVMPEKDGPGGLAVAPKGLRLG